METEDNYFTIKHEATGIFKDRGSKFIALAFHVSSEKEAKERLSEIKKQYYDARHHCFAYRINPEKEIYRSSDDGEPSGTAGKPILNQLFSKQLFNIIVIVVRYFGGTKLGTSGLINAYKTATNEAIIHAEIINKTIIRKITIKFDYPLINSVMRIVKEENLKIVYQKFELSCLLTIETKKSNEELIKKKFNTIFGVTLN